MKLIFKYIKPYVKSLVPMAICYMAMAASSLLLPSVMSNIVDNGIKPGDMTYIIYQGLIMIAIAVAAVVLALVSNKISARFSASFLSDLRKDVFAKVNSLSFEEFAEKGTATLLSRTTEDVWILQDAAVNLLYFVLVVPVQFIGGIVLTMVYNVTLGVVLLVASPVVVLLVALIGRKMFKLWDQADKSMDMQQKVMRGRLSGIRVIRSFDKEEQEHKRVAAATEDMAKNIIKSNVLSGFISPIGQIILNLVTVLVLYLGAKQVEMSSILTAGNIIATTQYIAVVMGGLMMISFSIVFLPSVLVSCKRLNEIFALKGVDMGESSGEKLDGSVEFSNVNFAYPHSPVKSLTDINLKINPGEVVGIIGGTGSGKTTLMKLLMNFYTPQEGVISLGGIPMEEMSKATARDNISIALQKAMIFQGTIEYNVKMGNVGASPELVDEVCAIAQMDEILESKEGGLQHSLRQAGSNLSGGQKQRISIARAVLKDASVYVFDDSFSALDYLTESKLRRRLNKYLAGKTQIIITQRAATAMRCDKIVVMDEGKIIAEGTHKQVLSSCKIYREIYQSQLGGQIDE